MLNGFSCPIVLKLKARRKTMLGAIIGDLAGSIYEYGQVQKHSTVKIKNIIEDDAFFSDDTILTVAIADAILHGKDYAKTLKQYALKFQSQIPKNVAYFKTMFSPNFLNWAKSNKIGSSHGNGAMMRISPVGNFFTTEEDVKKHARLATIPSHNSKEAVDCATKIALIIFYANQGLSKSEIIQKLDLKIKKPDLKSFNYTCADTIDVCLFSLFESNSFPEAIEKAISFGGDTDTNACIVGSMAEAMFGIDEDLKQKALTKLPKEFVDVVDEFYSVTKGISQPETIQGKN